MSTAYVYDPTFLEHNRPGHVECPERLEETVRVLEEQRLLAELVEVQPTSMAVRGDAGRVACHGIAYQRCAAVVEVQPTSIPVQGGAGRVSLYHVAYQRGITICEEQPSSSTI